VFETITGPTGTLEEGCPMHASNRIRGKSGAGRSPHTPPLPNGANGDTNVAPPLGNGQNGDTTGAAPSPNGHYGDASVAPPLPNGDNGEAATADQGTGRHSNGRFAKGNAGGPGNPFARQSAALRQALCDAVSEEDIQELAQELLAQAKAGNLAAMKLLFSYVIGRPAPAVDPDTLDQQEWERLKSVPVEQEDVKRILQGLPVGLATGVMRFALPHLEERLTKTLGREWEEFGRKHDARMRRKAARAARRNGAAGATTPGVGDGQGPLAMRPDNPPPGSGPPPVERANGR
jgi:hypothetical protein